MALESPKPVSDPAYHHRESSLTPPVFFGRDAERLGLAGIRADTPEGRQVYMNLFAGYTTAPDGERADRLPKYMHPKRRGAFEMIVSDPKDSSVLGEVAGDTRIEGVRLKARAAVAGYIEKHAEVKVTKKAEAEKCRPKTGRKAWRKTEGLIMVGWDHPATRAGDPNRHWHLVVMNLSHDRQEGIWKGIDLYHVDKAAASKVYRDAMRKGLHELGYKTRAKGSEYEIVGVPAEVKAKFSSRRNGIAGKIEEFEGKTGKSLSKEAKRKFGVYDRPEKGPDMPLADRQKAWRARLSPDQFAAVMGVVRKAYQRVKERVFEKSLSRWHEGIAQHASKLRDSVAFQEPEVPVRSRDNARSR